MTPASTSNAAKAPPSFELQRSVADSVGVSFRNLLRGELVNKGARFVAAALLARALSPHEYGTFNVAIAAAGIATSATGLGLGEVGGRDAAISPSQSAWLAGRVLA